MSDMRTCHICGTTTDTWCPTCTANFASRRNADEMTGDERAAELEAWLGPLEIEFGLLHQRIEELVGRSVWTHEMGSTWFPTLIREARTRDSPGMSVGMDEVVDRALSFGKPVVGVGISD